MTLTLIRRSRLFDAHAHLTLTPSTLTKYQNAFLSEPVFGLPLRIYAFEMDDYVAFIVEGVLLMIVGILGMVGNLSAITVFARQHLQKNFHALMLSLAVFDLVYILANFLCFSNDNNVKAL